MVHGDGRVGLDGIEVCFDDERAVADAGIVLAVTLAARLGLEALVDRFVGRGERIGAANAGAKVMTLVAAMLLRADSIDDCDVLRSGRTVAVLGHRVVAPSTLGTFLRAFTFGHVGHTRSRARRGATARLGRRRWTGRGATGRRRRQLHREVHGYRKQGAGFGYTRRRGYHPLLATRADTGEVLHVRLRKGSAGSPRGVLRFAEELIARGHARRRGRPKAAARRLGVLEQEADRQARKGRLAVLDQRAHAVLGPRGDRADPRARVAAPGRLPRRRRAADRRDVRRRAAADRPPHPPRRPQAELWPDWRYFPFITNRTEPLDVVEREHRQHAVVELAIRDLKHQALAHFPPAAATPTPPGRSSPALAHNLLRWTSLIGLPAATVAPPSLRRRLLTLAGRLTRSARKWTLHLPARWPWQHDFIGALARIMALPAAA